MTPIAVKTAYWFLLALVLAWLEIEIEGKFGWAQKLPTWYDTTSWIGRIYTKLMAGKPLTGYHLNIQVFTLMIVFVPYVHGVPFALVNVLMSLALFCVWASLWDFLWFVMNPSYGIGRYRQDTVWWFAKSYWPLGLFPMDYVNGLAISYVLAGAASYLSGEADPILNHTFMVIGWLVLTCAAVLCAPAYHVWRTRMNNKDDRDTLDIFHR